MKQRLYSYIGPKEIANRVAHSPPGVRVERPEDVLAWIRQTSQEPDQSGSVIATFVVDEEGWLRIADRRSEHVVCAGGRPVQSAGEITFAVSAGKLEVAWITNQSTGYGPEPVSWPAVRGALERADIEAPVGFSQEFIFRRCPDCRMINLIKKMVFECAVCSATLPAAWNLSLHTEPEFGTRVKDVL